MPVAKPPPAAAPAVPTAPAAGAGEGPAAPWEEVWRPRRKGRAFEGQPDRRRQQRARRPDKPPARELEPGVQAGTPRRKGPDRRRGGSGDRQERPRLHMQASPPASKAAFDPDSPFAALSLLKAQMEKRSQD